MPEQTKAIDCLITPNPASTEAPAGLGYLFPEMMARVRRGTTAEQLIEEMDEAGVEKGIISIQQESQTEWVLSTVERYPDRFIAALVVNPLNGMAEVRRVEHLVREHSVKAIRMGAWRIQKPYNDKVYFPFYVKAIELGIPIQCNVGFPGPRMPAWVQEPLHLDEVYWFFPEVKIVMTHVGEPWVGQVTKMLIRWPNAYLMTNSVSPKHYPQELIQFLNTRGYDKIMWGTEYPLLAHKRCMEEIKLLPLRDHVRPRFLRENALKVYNWENR